ncbi:MAG: hypothetical protein IPK29_15510 [Betaproteobacteria bacterium]|nr:hypothetical protein [Betaproteobacteria bacterium]
MFTGLEAGTTRKNGRRDTRPTGTKSAAVTGALAPISVGVTTIVEAAHRNSVCPSGADLAAASAPIMVLPPGRASTTNDWPSAPDRWLDTRRAAFSAPAPGGNGMITRTGLFGYCWAAAAPMVNVRAQARIARVNFILSPWLSWAAILCAAADASLTESAGPRYAGRRRFAPRAAARA